MKRLFIKNSSFSPETKLYLYEFKKNIRSHSFKSLTQNEKAYFFTLRSLKKKHEFIRSRFCLKKIFPYFKTHSFLKNELLPKNFTGSLSHKDKLTGILISQSLDKSYGIDLESLRVGEKVHTRVTNERERLLLKTDYEKETLWSLIFSIKESLFKAFSNGKFDIKTITDCEILSIDSKNGYFSGKMKATEQKAHGYYKFFKRKNERKLKKYVITSCYTLLPIQ